MIVYYKLGNILKERGMNWKDLCNAGISVNMPFKFSTNKKVSTDIIDRICTYLKVQPGDIMEWVEDEEQAKEVSIQSQMAELQRQLNELKK